jgi:hypothetical protein
MNGRCEDSGIMGKTNKGKKPLDVLSGLRALDILNNSLDAKNRPENRP